MTESEWLAECSYSQQMLWPLRETAKVTRTKAGRRKFRLFACACARLFWEHLHDQRLQEAVEVSERHAEGLATKEELAVARKRIDGLWPRKYNAATPQERTAAWLATTTTEEEVFIAAVKVVRGQVRMRVRGHEP